jgi:hypothetical protein
LSFDAQEIRPANAVPPHFQAGKKVKSVYPVIIEMRPIKRNERIKL